MRRKEGTEGEFATKSGVSTAESGGNEAAESSLGRLRTYFRRKRRSSGGPQSIAKATREAGRHKAKRIPRRAGGGVQLAQRKGAPWRTAHRGKTNSTGGF